MQHHTNEVPDDEFEEHQSTEPLSVNTMVRKILESLGPHGGMYDSYLDSIIVLEVKADNDPGFKKGRILLEVADEDPVDLDNAELYQDGITETVEVFLEELKKNGYNFLPTEVASLIEKIEEALVLENTDLQAIKESMAEAFPTGDTCEFTVRIQFTVTKDRAVLVVSGWVTWEPGEEPKNVSDMSGQIKYYGRQESQLWARGVQSFPKEV